MSDTPDIASWPESIRQRYEAYLKTSFFFKDPDLRASFQTALREEESLLKGPYPEPARDFNKGIGAKDLARLCFRENVEDLLPAMMDARLYTHQERAIRAAHLESQNVVVATGTASGKTETFLYPILFELYSQHLAGELTRPGVRALILYTMNALANDQRERLGALCNALAVANSSFEPTFGQYIGQTPEDQRDRWRNATWGAENRLPGELVFRSEMRNTPPHILLTNYSMLEYLLIRPEDSPLFDNGRSEHWQFMVLDEAHQYRGAKGMEMGMLIRRAKQRLRDGGRQAPFRCIATSATLSSGESEIDRKVVAKFAQELFAEPFYDSGIIFGESETAVDDSQPRRYHAFLRALEGAFLVHRDGKDEIILNRKGDSGNGAIVEPLEIALCKECGQHYYVGRIREGQLREAIRDPSHGQFGVDYYRPTENGNQMLCKACGVLSNSVAECDCDDTASVRVKKCENQRDHADRLKECEACGYQRGGIGDPVQEIVHGSDGPNAVIATALHELLPEGRRKILAFTDSRQEAAFFAWYAEDSYEKLRDRNQMLQAIMSSPVSSEGLSIDDLANRLLHKWDEAGLFHRSDTSESRRRKVLTAMLREAVTDQRRLSLSGVGLVKWFVAVPNDLLLPNSMGVHPWNLTEEEPRNLVQYLLGEMLRQRAINLPDVAGAPPWNNLATWPQRAYCHGIPGTRKDVSQWGNQQSAVVQHFLHRLCPTGSPAQSTELMEEIWDALQQYGGESILTEGRHNGTFRLNPNWLRIKPTTLDEVWECGTCATLSAHNIRGICPRNRCHGSLEPTNQTRLAENHYRSLYENPTLPAYLRAEEHTAQIDSDTARKRQNDFKSGDIHLLSSSTTFEVGVDLGDLDAVFLRNVPPEPFNYTQRVGRAGRQEPGLAVTYCRRNPHDLYHYNDPEERVINGVVHPPRLRMTNEKIVLRHMVAVALSEFFKQNQLRFRHVEDFVGSWEEPRAASDLQVFCEDDSELEKHLRHIVPNDMHAIVGLATDSWIDNIAGPESRLEFVTKEVCSDYLALDSLRKQYIEERKDDRVSGVGRRIRTIAEESTLNFLSRKAVIPKYGFPVDVVELDTRPINGKPTGVALQRDLSQAISEYAPGGRVVANKLEWESYGIKVVTGKAWPVRHYQYDEARSFRQWNEGDLEAPQNARKYLIPEFGFVTPLFKKPREPRGRAHRVYTTRPFFRGFSDDTQPETREFLDVQITKAQPGTLVILCEGRHQKGFYICCKCGTHSTERKAKHTTPSDTKCNGTLQQFSLGHELVTDVVRLQFPKMSGEWTAYSVAYAVLFGAAESLNVPSTDLNVTIAAGATTGESTIVLYDNVPGGAGLVAQLEHANTFREVPTNAAERVQGTCGCDSSCYGCLRSYRNQFAHPYLYRKTAAQFLESALNRPS